MVPNSNKAVVPESLYFNSRLKRYILSVSMLNIVEYWYCSINLHVDNQSGVAVFLFEAVNMVGWNPGRFEE